MGDLEGTALRTVEHSIPIDILSDLLTRFLICVPEDAKKNLIRICFQIELAHWFYLDFYVTNDESLKSCGIYEFAAHVFQYVPFLKNDLPNLDSILAKWKDYKQSVPTYGAIILSEGCTHVLLVQSFWTKSSWGFPKGKVNEEEDPAHCAVREVLEETGFDISPHINPDDFVETTIHDQLVRLYIIKNIPMSTKFQPRTRCEIKACSWFAIQDLPANRKDSTPKVKMGVSAKAFFMVFPFVKKLRQISHAAKTNSTKRNRLKSSSLSENESSSVKPKAKPVKPVETLETSAKKKPEKKAHTSKRQLTFDSEFCAPSWLNFKFDKMAILECMP